MSVAVQLPPLAEYQTRAMFCAERFSVIEATTKAGKTFGCIIWLLHEALRAPRPGVEYWWVAPIYEQAKIAYRRMREMLGQTDPRRSWHETNESDPSIKLANGAVVRFKSADKPDGLYGEDVLAAVVDEASRCKEAAWHAVRSTLTATSGSARIIGNVRGAKNWAYRLARRVESGDLPGWRFAKITAADAVKAGMYSAEELESARRELPEAVFRELYFAEASEDGSNPFGIQHIRACVGELSTDEPVAFGVDLARSHDWTVVYGLDATGRVCRFERWQGVPWGDTINRIAAIVRDLPTEADATGVGDPVVEALQAVCPQVQGFKFSAESKQRLMQGLAVAIQRHEITIPDDAVTVGELESFEYQHTATGTRYSAPEGMHDDCVCALALAVKCWRERGEPGFIGSFGFGNNLPESITINVNGPTDEWGEQRSWRKL